MSPAEIFAGDAKARKVEELNQLFLSYVQGIHVGGYTWRALLNVRNRLLDFLYTHPCVVKSLCEEGKAIVGFVDVRYSKGGDLSFSKYILKLLQQGAKNANKYVLFARRSDR